MKRLAIISTHPIQYYAPMFQLLAKECELKVLYTWGKSSTAERYDPDFGQSIVWDIPLLDGYTYEFVKNVAKDPGSHHFRGINNPSLIKQIDSFQPDVIIVYGWAYKSHLKVIRHFKNKIPVWLRGDSNLLDEKPGLKKMLRGLALKWVFSYLNKALFVGTANKAYFKKYGLKDSQLIFVPHAIDNRRFMRGNGEEREKFRRELGLGENDLLVTFAGKLESKKSPQLLLDAFTSLKMPHVHLLFAGGGHLENELKNNVSQDSLRQVHFLSFQNQTKMPVIYQACDVFCLPSKGPGESWGLAINEAMAAGKAVLVSDRVGCAIDLVKEGVNGYIFESENRTDLMEKLFLLLRDGEQLAEMGRQSSIIIKDWSFEKQTESIINELNK